MDDFSTNNYTLITFDSLRYRDRAIEFAQAFNGDYQSIFEFIALYGLNYSGISILGAFAQTDAGFNDWYIFLFNSLLLAVIYWILFSILKTQNLRSYGVIITLALFLYIPFSLIQLNKEIIGFAFIALLIYALHKKSRWGLIFIALCFGFIRMQYFVMALMLLFVPRPRALLLLLFINLFVYIALPPSLEGYDEAVGETVHSLGLMQLIEDISYIPVFGLFGYLIRILVSIFIGFYSPIKIFMDVLPESLIRGSLLSLPGTLIYHSSLFLFSGAAVVSAYQHYKIEKYKLTIAPIYYTNLFVLFVFCSVTSIAPFLQPRYYFPLFFLFAINQACFRFAIRPGLRKT